MTSHLSFISTLPGTWLSISLIGLLYHLFTKCITCLLSVSLVCLVYHLSSICLPFSRLNKAVDSRVCLATSNEVHSIK